MQFEASVFKAACKCTFCLFLWISKAHTGDKKEIWNMVKTQFFTVSCYLLQFILSVYLGTSNACRGFSDETQKGILCVLAHVRHLGKERLGNLVQKFIW